MVPPLGRNFQFSAPRVTELKRDSFRALGCVCVCVFFFFWVGGGGGGGGGWVSFGLRVFVSCMWGPRIQV